MSFAALLDEAVWVEDGFAATIPESWHQGRTAYGGFSAALALAAARHVGGGELPPLRSAQVSFVGPLAGAVRASARVLRRGRNAVWMSAEVTGEGVDAPGLVASFVFMRAVESTVALNDAVAPPGLIAPEDAAPALSPHAPAFLKNHFEVRFALPRSAEKQPEITWWVRLRDQEGAARLDPFLHLLLIADALPPGVLPLMHPGVAVSSMGWQANVLSPAPASRDGWWLLRSSADYAESGCSSQMMRIWNADGAPMMAGMQSVALFG